MRLGAPGAPADRSIDRHRAEGRRAQAGSKHSTQHGTHSTGYARQVGEGEPRAGHLVGEAEGRAPFGGEAALLPPRPCSCSIPPTCTHGKSACVRKHVCRNMCAETGSNQHVCRNCFCISSCVQKLVPAGARMPDAHVVESCRQASPRPVTLCCRPRLECRCRGQ